MSNKSTNILVRMSGGLGNQLFQLAASLFISRKVDNAAITLDTRFLADYDTLRVFELDFLIKYYPFIEVSTCPSYKLGVKGLLSKFRVARIIDSRIHNLGLIGSDLGVKRLECSNLRSLVLDGYFQNPELLMSQEERTYLLERLKLDFGYLKSKINFTNIDNKVSVHIRRGDYVSNASAASEFLTVDLDYYRKAIKKFPKNTIFFVFGDDTQLVRDFAHEINGVNVQSLALTLQEEFVLMADSVGYIIANSTLSWWAAFLGFSQGKRVISPSKWFVSEKRNINNDLQLDYFELI